MVKNRLHHESGEPVEEPTHLVNKDEYDKEKKFSLKITSPALDLTDTQDWQYWLPSPSSS